MSAKDYFQDITPPTSPEPRASRGSSNPPSPPLRPPAPSTSDPRETSMEDIGVDTPERSVRNIQITPTRRPRMGTEDVRDGSLPRPLSERGGRGGRSGWALWGSVVLALLVLGTIGLVALRPTTVTVLPRSHAVLFDETARFTAYPAASAATGTLSFTVEVQEFEDSQVVPAQGIERVEDRAQGTLTVYNSYSASPVKLIKNTRFQTPQGLIFKAPAEIVIPGKKGSVPGQIAVTVFAEKAGEKYNIGPVDKFILPGLKSTPAMYTGVYARSTSAMSGGFVGERPAASPAALESARAEIRSRLQEKIRAAASRHTNETTFAFADLARVTFESLTPTIEREGEVRIAERARMELPLFPSDAFAYTIGQSVSAEAEQDGITLRPGEGFAAQLTGTSSDSFALSPLSFTLRGQAQLVWKVNTTELTEALAAKDESAFQTIVQGFPGIEEAHARIEPFWKNSFPANPSAIKVKMREPEPAA